MNFAAKKKRRGVALYLYLHNELKCAGNISIAANNNDYVDIADPHVKERAAADLSNRTSSEIFRLHYMRSKGIHHISTEQIHPSKFQITINVNDIYITILHTHTKKI